jgi:GntR family transcriptional regulator, histidine utilization repressor
MSQARYQQVKDFVCQGIRSLDYQEGEQVPSENALAEICGVSRMTARRALKELTDEGTLVSKQGLGTYVAPAKSRTAVLKVRNIADEIHARGQTHSVQVLALKALINPAIAAKFELAPKTPVFYTEILHFEDQKPIQLEQRFVNPSIAKEFLEQDFNQLTTHEYLMRVSPLSEVEHQISAIIADNKCRELLQIAKDEACLKVSRSTWSEQTMASIAWLYHPGNRYQLQSHLVLKQKG